MPYVRKGNAGSRNAGRGFAIPAIERLKSKLVRTPFERPLESVRRWFLRIRHLRNPTLARLCCSDPVAIEAYCSQTLRANDNCVDVGAHLGSFLSMLLRLAPNGQHAAFEPIPAKAKLLSRRFPEVTVHELALGQTNELKTFYFAHAATSASGLVRSAWHGSAYSEFEVTQVRLDEVIPLDNVVNFLKLDVEGNELNVLRGATRILNQQQPLILFESTRKALARSLFELLEECDYLIFAPQEVPPRGSPLLVSQFEKGHQWPFRAFNYFAIPRAYTEAHGNDTSERRGR